MKNQNANDRLSRAVTEIMDQISQGALEHKHCEREIMEIVIGKYNFKSCFEMIQECRERGISEKWLHLSGLTEIEDFGKSEIEKNADFIAKFKAEHPEIKWQNKDAFGFESFIPDLPEDLDFDQIADLPEEEPYLDEDYQDHNTQATWEERYNNHMVENRNLQSFLDRLTEECIFFMADYPELDILDPVTLEIAHIYIG